MACFVNLLSFFYLCRKEELICNYLTVMRISGVVILMFSLLNMLSCAAVRADKVSFRSLDVKAFERVLSHDDVWLVDVRTPAEHEQGCIEGTDQNLNVKGDKFFSEYKSLPKDKVIALYCKGGGRSKQVAGVLAGNGYKVVELSVGYDGWVKAKEGAK